MAQLSPTAAEVASDVARIAAEPHRIEQRAVELVEPLRRVLPFCAAWISVLDPERREQPPLVCEGHSDALRAYMTGPAGVAEIERLALDRSREAARLADLPVPLDEVRSWAEYLAPAGIRGGVAAALRTPDGRYLGMLGLNTDTTRHPTVAARDLLTLLSPLIAHALDPMRSIQAAARIVHDATAATVLTRAGDTVELPGLPTHTLLAAGSGVLTAAADHLAAGARFASFLSPHTGQEPPAADQARITVLARPPEPPRHLVAVLTVSPPGDLRGLTGRDLEILGMLVEDWPTRRIASALELAPGTVYTQIRQIQDKLAAPNRATATLRAHHQGLYIPLPISRRQG